MKIENASFVDINDGVRLIHVIGSGAVKIQQKSMKPPQTPFDKSFEEVLLSFEEIEEMLKAINYFTGRNSLASDVISKIKIK